MTYSIRAVLGRFLEITLSFNSVSDQGVVFGFRNFVRSFIQKARRAASDGSISDGNVVDSMYFR